MLIFSDWLPYFFCPPWPCYLSRFERSPRHVGASLPTSPGAGLAAVPPVRRESLELCGCDVRSLMSERGYAGWSGPWRKVVRMNPSLRRAAQAAHSREGTLRTTFLQGRNQPTDNQPSHNPCIITNFRPALAQLGKPPLAHAAAGAADGGARRRWFR